MLLLPSISSINFFSCIFFFSNLLRKVILMYSLRLKIVGFSLMYNLSSKIEKNHFDVLACLSLKEQNCMLTYLTLQKHRKQRFSYKKFKLTNHNLYYDFVTKFCCVHTSLMWETIWIRVSFYIVPADVWSLEHFRLRADQISKTYMCANLQSISHVPFFVLALFC